MKILLSYIHRDYWHAVTNKGEWMCLIPSPEREEKSMKRERREEKWDKMVEGSGVVTEEWKRERGDQQVLKVFWKMNLPQVQGWQGLIFGTHERGPKSILNLRQNLVESSFSFWYPNILCAILISGFREILCLPVEALSLLRPSQRLLPRLD